MANTDSNLVVKTQKSVIDYILYFRKSKKFILFFTLVFFLLAISFVYLVLDPVFYSNSLIRASGKSSSGLGSLLSAGAGGMPDIGDLASLSGGGSSTKELALYEQILLSRRCLEETIIKFDLMNEYKVKYMQDAIKIFRDNVIVIQKDRIAGTLELGIFDTSPQRSKEIVEFLLDRLNKINLDLNIQSAKSNREFIEARYNIVKSDLEKVEDSLKTFQDKYGLAPDIQYKAISQAYMQLEADVKSEEIKLELLKQILSPDQAEIKTQEDKIAALRTQANSIKNTDETEFTLKGAPDVVINFLRLQRALEIQNKLVAYMIPLYEQAKIEEKRETPTIQIIDYPNVPEKKKKPERVKMVFGITVFGFFVSLVFIIIMDNYKKLKIIYKNKIVS